MDWKHLNYFIVLGLYGKWKLCLTYLTLKFLEVIVKSSTHNFLLYLHPNPLHHALYVHCPTRAWAFAGIEQKIILRVSFFQANLASYIILFLFILGGVFHGFASFNFLILSLYRSNFLADAYLTNKEFHPP